MACVEASYMRDIVKIFDTAMSPSNERMSSSQRSLDSTDHDLYIVALFRQRAVRRSAGYFDHVEHWLFSEYPSVEQRGIVLACNKTIPGATGGDMYDAIY